MNSFSKYLCLGALGLGLWSCSSDEPVSTEVPKFEGNQASMTINLYGPSGLTRADGQDGDYEDGTDTENAVSTLSFFFYDNAGEYVTSVENVTYEPITDEDGKNAPTGSALVEEIGKSKIVLTGLAGKDYPSYMVAVINGGAQLNLKERNLEEAASLARTTSWSGTTGAENNFVMTSATHSGNTSGGYYFATHLEKKHFAEMNGNEVADDAFPEVSETQTAVPVDIYVERLASKVELKFANKFTKTADGIYEVTLGDKYNIDGTEKDIKIQLLGWNINGTAKRTKYFKEVNSTFTTDDGWNYDGTNRCYWAKTLGYGSNSYPSSFEDVNKKYTGEAVDALAGIDAKDEILTYINWNQVKGNKFNYSVMYTNPHTDRKDCIIADGNLIHGGVTEILIAGQIVDSDDKPLTLYQLGLQFFTEDNVIPHVLNAIADLNIWKKMSDETTKTIEISDLAIDFLFDGAFKLKFSDDAAKDWYKDSQCTEKWASASDVINYINSHLPNKQTYAYVNGMLYYNIPIRHLRGFGANNAIQTGTYGVVRNHHYEVTVNNILNLGHAVYRPNEDIIPPSESTRFMIGSSVRILSWRLVKQGVDL